MSVTTNGPPSFFRLMQRSFCKFRGESGPSGSAPYSAAMASSYESGHRGALSRSSGDGVAAVKISDQSWLQTTVLLEQGSDQLKFDCEAEWQEKHQFLKAEFPFDLLPHNGVASPGRHCHSTLSLSVIDCHSLGIHQYVVILLSWLSFLSK